MKFAYCRSFTLSILCGRQAVAYCCMSAIPTRSSPFKEVGINKKTRLNKTCFLLVWVKGLAPLRYHAGVAKHGCPSFVADRPSYTAVCLRFPPVQAPFKQLERKKNPTPKCRIFFGMGEGTCSATLSRRGGKAWVSILCRRQVVIYNCMSAIPTRSSPF